jgi:hypothetical protein
MLIGERALQANRLVISFEHAVHGGTIEHRGGHVARDSPLPLELELERTDFVAFDRGSAQAIQWERWGHRQPLGGT